MISIICSSAVPHHLEQFRAWCLSEWGKIDPFESNMAGMVVPEPLLAVDQSVLIGGLAFTGYAKPETEELGVWVNALYVEKQHRGLGIASMLLHAGEESARRYAVSELFAYTDAAGLYKKTGWVTLSVENENEVVSKRLTNY